MATYSTQYPIAFHVLPLHALKGVFERGALLSKADGTDARPTTARVDRALGLDGFVHFYLGRFPDATLRAADTSSTARRVHQTALPHVVLELRTATLTDSDSVICNWNLAVSRPTTDQVKGGNWTRGTNPDQIAAVWRSFRSSNPPLARARGYFNDPYLVPTLRGSQIQGNLRLLRSAPRGLPELLLRSPVELQRLMRLLVFSRRDFTALKPLDPLRLPAAEYDFPGYQADLVPEETRRQIEAYIRSPKRSKPPELDFDSVRPSPNSKAVAATRCRF